MLTFREALRKFSRDLPRFLVQLRIVQKLKMSNYFTVYLITSNKYIAFENPDT